MYYIWRYIIEFTDNTNLTVVNREISEYCYEYMTPILRNYDTKYKRFGMESKICHLLVWICLGIQ